MQLAIQHLMLTQTAQAVLPATLRPLDGPVGGARTSGGLQLIHCIIQRHAQLQMLMLVFLPWRSGACRAALTRGFPRTTKQAGHMLLDACALRSLELLSNSEGRVRAVWDLRAQQACTAMMFEALRCDMRLLPRMGVLDQGRTAPHRTL